MMIQRRCMSGVAQMCQIVGQQLASIKEAGTWKTERVITTPQRSFINVEGSDKKLLNFCANNYLGLSADSQVIAASKHALDTHGAGLSSVRFICGTQDIHKDLERKISLFHEREDTILYISCFDANAGIFETLLTPDDVVLSDELNHASIIDGIRLCKAKKMRYKHRDMKALEENLIAARDGGARMILIATDGVFSMDGTVAPLKEICDLADKYNAITFIDECHATGFFGKTGRGTEEYLDLKGRVDIINSTLGKALGGAAGGYTTGPKELVSLLRQKSRPYLFSNTLPPPVVASADKEKGTSQDVDVKNQSECLRHIDCIISGGICDVLREKGTSQDVDVKNQVFELLLDGTNLTEKVKANTQLFRQRMTDAGFNVIGDGHPICPVMMKDERTAVNFADEMLKRDIYVIGFTFPVVPKGKARIRVQLSAAHSIEDVNKCVDAFIDVGKSLDVL